MGSCSALIEVKSSSIACFDSAYLRLTTSLCRPRNYAVYILPASRRAISRDSQCRNHIWAGAHNHYTAGRFHSRTIKSMTVTGLIVPLRSSTANCTSNLLPCRASASSRFTAWLCHHSWLSCSDTAGCHSRSSWIIDVESISDIESISDWLSAGCVTFQRYPIQRGIQIRRHSPAAGVRDELLQSRARQQGYIHTALWPLWEGTCS